MVEGVVSQQINTQTSVAVKALRQERENTEALVRSIEQTSDQIQRDAAPREGRGANVNLLV